MTFAESSKPPQEIPTPRVAIEKMSNPRVAIKKVTINKAMSNDVPNYTPRELGAKLNHLICSAANNRARIQNRHQMSLHHQDRNKRAQLIHDKETGEYLNYGQLIRDPKHRETWEQSAANEFGRLAQGLKDGRVTGTNTIYFIHKDKVPNERRKDVTYGSFSCDMKPNKEGKYCTRLTAGGDRINYPDDVGTPTVDMTLFKCLMNSIISTPGAQCIMVDIKVFYLCIPMKRPEYMRLKKTDIPEETMTEYQLQELMTVDRYVYCEIAKGMYGLPQSGIIAQELLTERLVEYGYHQSKIILGLLTHETRRTTFTLLVDNFAIKIMSENNAKH